MLSFEPPLAGAGDIDIPRCVDNGDEAIAIISEYHSRWLDSARTEELRG